MGDQDGQATMPVLIRITNQRGHRLVVLHERGEEDVWCPLSVAVPVGQPDPAEAHKQIIGTVTELLNRLAIPASGVNVTALGQQDGHWLADVTLPQPVCTAIAGVSYRHDARVYFARDADLLAGHNPDDDYFTPECRHLADPSDD